ncbi:MAG: CBS domain-containing protein [Legionellales bacterium]|jgi:CBS domain-containing protein
MKVKQLMNKRPDYITPDTTVQMAAEEMLRRDIGFLPIGDDFEDRLVGALTDRDIATRCVAKKHDASKVLVKSIMTPKILYCFEDDDIEIAAESMERMQVHRLAVLNEKKRLVGVLSLGDIAAKTHNPRLCGEILEKICEISRR